MTGGEARNAYQQPAGSFCAKRNEEWKELSATYRRFPLSA
jgi:hypothetical protein